MAIYKLTKQQQARGLRKSVFLFHSQALALCFLCLPIVYKNRSYHCPIVKMNMRASTRRT